MNDQPTDHADARPGDQHVIFQLGETRFGVGLRQVSHIARLSPITRVPRAPHFLTGVINHHGQVIPVVDLRHRLGLAQDVLYGDKARIIIVDLGAQYTGMLVDAVTGIWRLPPDSSKPPPKKGTQVDGIYLSGVAHYDGRNVLLLDLGRVLTVDEVNQVNAWQAKDNPEPES